MAEKEIIQMQKKCNAPLHFYWQPTHSGVQRKGKPCRYALLSQETALSGGR